MPVPEAALGHAIARGPKRIENRRWLTRHRGLLLIHSGSSRVYMDVTAFPDGSPAPPEHDLAFGAILGLVNRQLAQGLGEDLLLPNGNLLIPVEPDDPGDGPGPTPALDYSGHGRAIRGRGNSRSTAPGQAGLPWPPFLNRAPPSDRSPAETAANHVAG